MAKTITLTLGILFLFVQPVLSVETLRPNNKFGMHLAQPNFEDLKAVSDLVNSNGGKWGYVTLVLQEDDRNLNKWQEIFDRLRELHLIPIIRLATKPVGAAWRRPDKKEAEEWLRFLDSLNWVVKERYVVLFNEPNHSGEWGGRVDPGSYTEVALSLAKKLKEKTPDFFIMLAGFDAAAPSSPPMYEDEEIFLRQVINNKTIDQWEYLLSGLASHSYPIDFVGSPRGAGRKSVRSYAWELELFDSLGIKKSLPVFITETGWKHNGSAKSKVQSSKSLFPETAANYFESVFRDVWLGDDRVRAVTPFILDYQTEPFLDFSWKKYQTDDFYPQYFTIQNMNKTKGEPEFVEKGELSFDLPKELVVYSSYRFPFKIRNLGQSIFDKEEGYRLSGSYVTNNPLEYFFTDLKDIKPFEETSIDFHLKTGKETGKNEIVFSLINDKQKNVISKTWKFEVVSLPQISFGVDLYPKHKINGNDFEIQIFDKNEQLVFTKKKIDVKNSLGVLDNVKNVSLNEKYRLVLLKPYYLPRQLYLIFSKGENRVRFESMYPIDFSLDGKFDGKDIWALMVNPKLFSLLTP